MRRVAYVSGTRADFGLMRRSLALIDNDDSLELGLIITGSHLDPKYGDTVKDIYSAGLTVWEQIPVKLEPRDGHTMSIATSDQIKAISQSLSRHRPDILLLLGDRPEMLAAAIAGMMLGIVIVHLHGGERSGSIDESIRHAISKLSHYHFVATNASAERLHRMGERADRIFQVGAPGLVGICEDASYSRQELATEMGINLNEEYALIVYHPVVQEQGSLGEQIRVVIDGIRAASLQAVLLRPNSDAGGDEIDRIIDTVTESESFHALSHLKRDQYLSLMKHAVLKIGNSSSGIIEAASFGTPAIDVGSRQNLRERGDNVFAAECTPGSISAAITRARSFDRTSVVNPYGDGTAGENIVRYLQTIDIDKSVLAKVNEY